MKMLLTSGGVTNPSIENALIELLGKPISRSTALFIPTAVYGQRNAIQMARKVLTGESLPMINMGWKSIEYLELISLPSAGRDTWKDAVRELTLYSFGAATLFTSATGCANPVLPICSRPCLRNWSTSV